MKMNGSADSKGTVYYYTMDETAYMARLISAKCSNEEILKKSEPFPLDTTVSFYFSL